MVNFHPVPCSTLQQPIRALALCPRVQFVSVPSQALHTCSQNSVRLNSLRRPLDRLLLSPERSVRLVESKGRGQLQMSILMNC